MRGFYFITAAMNPRFAIVRGWLSNRGSVPPVREEGRHRPDPSSVPGNYPSLSPERASKSARIPRPDRAQPGSRVCLPLTVVADSLRKAEGRDSFEPDRFPDHGTPISIWEAFCEDRWASFLGDYKLLPVDDR